MKRFDFLCESFDTYANDFAYIDRSEKIICHFLEGLSGQSILWNKTRSYYFVRSSHVDDDPVLRSVHTVTIIVTGSTSYLLTDTAMDRMDCLPIFIST